MFLQALLAMLAGEERCLALSRMATRLNAAVALGCQARGTYEGCKQMPCFVTNLPRDIFPFSAQSEPLPSTDTQGGMEEEEESGRNPRPLRGKWRNTTESPAERCAGLCWSCPGYEEILGRIIPRHDGLGWMSPCCSMAAPDGSARTASQPLHLLHERAAVL